MGDVIERGRIVVGGEGGWHAKLAGVSSSRLYYTAVLASYRSFRALDFCKG